MIAAVDTNVLLDILIPDDHHIESSKRLLTEYATKGSLIACEIVVAELASQFGSEHELSHFFKDTGIRLVSSSINVLFLAGERWRLYASTQKRTIQYQECGINFVPRCQSRGKPTALKQRVLPDFIVGAHALLNADLLLTRDRGFYKSYFKDLKIS